MVYRVFCMERGFEVFAGEQVVPVGVTVSLTVVGIQGMGVRYGRWVGTACIDNLETTQDIARGDSILLAVWSEYSFGCSALPRRDWCLFKHPLLSLLSSSALYLDTWLLCIKIACSRQTLRRLTAPTPPCPRPKTTYQIWMAPVTSSNTSWNPSLLPSRDFPLVPTCSHTPQSSLGTSSRLISFGINWFSIEVKAI
jgi:hypothetical protein